ncbi:unnamed protein product, partial [Prorocentrum cordatum]
TGQMDSTVALLIPTGARASDGNLSVALHALKEEWVPTSAEANLLAALRAMSEKMMANDAYSGLDIFATPFAVKAKKDFGVNCLNLAPVTDTIKERGATEKSSDKAIDLGQVIGGLPVSFSLVHHVVANKPDGNFCAPFWAAQPAPNKVKGNMEYINKTLNITIDQDDDPIGKVTVTIPVMTNTVAVKAGDILHLVRKRGLKRRDSGESASGANVRSKKK